MSNLKEVPTCELVKELAMRSEEEYDEYSGLITIQNNGFGCLLFVVSNKIYEKIPIEEI